MFECLLNRHALRRREPIMTPISFSSGRRPGRKDSRQASLDEVHRLRRRFRTDLMEIATHTERELTEVVSASEASLNQPRYI